ncbi:MAG: molecular chaperone HtpG [Desulfovibrionales bacterium]
MAEQENRYEFKAEIKQLLNIIANSLYTNREIFLRELVSNASDALDKLRFETSRGAVIADPDLDQKIQVTVDKDNSILTVSDTGIGMNREEIMANIGTIARSGSAEFIKMVSQDKEHTDSIIGRFGVGFYSVFMVADKAVVTTKSFRPEDPAVRWESDGSGEYTVAVPEGEVKRGTTIELHIKEDAKEFLDEYRLKEVIKRHSNFISFPVYLQDEKVNTVPALWREPKFSVKEEQYTEFYKFLTYDSDPPLETLHLSVDAPVQFNALVFIPGKDQNPFGWDPERYGLDLYARRVLIQSGNKDLIPQYLGFLRGVVDTEDLPLNISRETLQENALIRKIASTLTKQVLSRLEKLAADDPDKYQTFWLAHSKIFKLGYTDFANREQFGKLLRFNSSHFEDAQTLTSLDEYVDRAKKDQKEIYYITGPSREAIRLNPHLEILRRKGLEVLYLYETIDEFVLEGLGTYKEFKLVSTENVDVNALEKFETVDETEKVEEMKEEEVKTFTDLLARIKEILDDRVKDVRESKRLKESPAVLVSPDGMTSQMQKMMRLMSKDETVPPKILEINPDHPLTRNLVRIYQKDPKDEFITLAVEQLFGSALLLDGYLPDPHALVDRMNTLLSRSSGWYTEIKGS